MQPSLHVDEELAKKADEIFDREQEAIIAHAVAEDNGNRNALYVNEHGYVPLPPSYFAKLISR